MTSESGELVVKKEDPEMDALEGGQSDAQTFGLLQTLGLEGDSAFNTGDMGVPIKQELEEPESPDSGIGMASPQRSDDSDSSEATQEQRRMSRKRSDPSSDNLVPPSVFAAYLHSTYGYEGALAYAASVSAEKYVEDARLYSESVVPRKRERKPRENYEKSQQIVLEEFYTRTTHPNVQEKTELAERIGLSYLRVQKWFENRRQRDKKNKAV